MKENIDIEKLFQEKFENFEGNVEPSVWANVSQSINAGAAGTGAATGMSVISKVAIITAVAVTSVGVWYATSDKDGVEENQNVVLNEENNDNEVAENVITLSEEDIQVSDTNDPVIQEQIETLQEEFNPIELPIENLDEELVDILLEINSNDNHSTEEVIEENNHSTVESSDQGNTGQQEDEVVESDVKPIISNLEYEVEDNVLAFKSGAKNHYSVEWDFGDGNVDYNDTGEHEYERPGTYNAVMTITGESGTKTVPFKVVVEGTSSISMIPNVFTPDNDGHNDYFYIESEGLDEFLIVIYDLNTQEEVFRSEDPDFRWNGQRYDGSVKTGKYIFKIIAEGEDGAIHKEAKQLHITKK